jgi:AcrR family transcriptional regulator
MPISERRLKERQEMQQHILSTARDIAALDGWQNLTIRKICEKINYTAPVIYQYFESKDKILECIRMDGLHQIHSIFKEINKTKKSYDERMLEYGLAWWYFAEKNPEIYQLMYNLQGAVCSNDKNISLHIIEFYFEAFKILNSKANRSATFRLELCDNFIALIHGFIAIKMVNKNKSGNDVAEKVYKNSLKRFIQSIKH